MFKEFLRKLCLRCLIDNYPAHLDYLVSKFLNASQKPSKVFLNMRPAKYLVMQKS